MVNAVMEVVAIPMNDRLLGLTENVPWFKHAGVHVTENEWTLGCVSIK